MALQAAVRFSENGVWREQQAARVALEQRVAERDAQLLEAQAEVDRVHAQCVGLLRENRELEATLAQTQQLLARRDDELEAAKRNVAELTRLLAQANEDRARVERERNSTVQLWHHARNQETHAQEAIGALQTRQQAEEDEARRMRDLLYDAQEQCAYQQQQLERQRHEIDVLMHSNDTKDSQVVALVRERDGYAQKLAQYRSSGGSNRDHRHSIVQPQVTQVIAQETVKQEPVAPRVEELMAEYDEEKHKLIIIAQQAKARYKREQEHNATLQKRVESLEKSHAELLVRFRAASKARQRGSVEDREGHANAA